MQSEIQMNTMKVAVLHLIFQIFKSESFNFKKKFHLYINDLTPNPEDTASDCIPSSL